MLECWKVYCYTGENGKKYIGITSNSLYRRAGKDGYNYIRDNCSFGQAIKKYGFNFFTAEILEDGLTEEKAKELEQYYIEKFDTYKNGYNNTLGGDGTLKTDRELVLKLWHEKHSISYIKEITNYGDFAIQNALDSYGIFSDERISMTAGQYHATMIYQYDLDGNYITSYNSIASAAKATNCYDGNIKACLDGRRQTAGNFQWSKEKQEKMPPYKRNIGWHKIIYQYDQNKNLIQQFSSVAEVERILGFDRGYVAKQARKSSKAYGFIWSYNKI